MKSTAIYARISDDADGRALGVIRQIEDCQELAARSGWQVTGEPYVDNDVSATRGIPRPAYQRLLVDMAAGRVEAVVVWALDRLHRRPVELEHFMALAEEHGVRLASVSGEVDLSTEDGQFHARIMGAVAAKEARAISRRVLRKQQELRDRGLPFGGGIRCFGYAADRLTVIPAEAAEIRKMAAGVIAGQSVGSIVRDLNTRGVPTVSQWMAAQARPGRRASVVGKPWTVTSVRTLLGRPRLAGVMTYKGEVIGPGAWEAILDADTFAKAQAALKVRAASRSAAKGTRYLLSGIATCGQCGRGLQFSWNRREDLKAYRCPSEKHGSRNMRALDGYVADCFFEFLDVLHGAATQPGGEDPSVEIDTLTARLAEAADQFADGGITAAQMQRISQRLRSRIDELEALRPHPAEETFLDWYLGTTDRDQARVEWKALDVTQQRLMLAAHVGRIVVHRAKVRNHGLDTSTIDVVWKAGAVDDVPPELRVNT